MLWPPQTEGESVPSDQDEQDSGELCEGVTEGEPVKYNLGWARLLITVLTLHYNQLKRYKPFTFINNHVLISHKVEIKHFKIYSMIHD